MELEEALALDNSILGIPRDAGADDALILGARTRPHESVSLVGVQISRFLIPESRTKPAQGTFLEASGLLRSKRPSKRHEQPSRKLSLKNPTQSLQLAFVLSAERGKNTRIGPATLADQQRIFGRFCSGIPTPLTQQRRALSPRGAAPTPAGRAGPKLRRHGPEP